MDSLRGSFVQMQIEGHPRMHHRALSSGQLGRADAHAAREDKSGVARSHFGSTGVGTERSLFLCFHCEAVEHFIIFPSLSDAKRSS